MMPRFYVFNCVGQPALLDYSVLVIHHLIVYEEHKGTIGVPSRSAVDRIFAKLELDRAKRVKLDRICQVIGDHDIREVRLIGF